MWINWNKLVLRLDSRRWAHKRQWLTVSQFFGADVCPTKSCICLCFENCFSANVTKWSNGHQLSLHFDPRLGAFNMHTMTVSHNFGKVLYQTKSYICVCFAYVLKKCFCANTNLSLVGNELVLMLDPVRGTVNDMFKWSSYVSSWTIMMNFLYISWCIRHVIYVSVQ